LNVLHSEIIPAGRGFVSAFALAVEWLRDSS
jgi:hypothetical protein